MDGGLNPPYRPYCPGTPGSGCQRTAANAPRTGPCSSSKKVPAYHSTVQVGGSDPASRLAMTTCGETNGGGVGPWPWPYPAQTFAQAGTVDLGVARKRGFKNVQAQRFWHGSPPLNYACGVADLILKCDADCGYHMAEPFHGTFPQTKYLSKVATVSIVKSSSCASGSCDCSSYGGMDALYPYAYSVSSTHGSTVNPQSGVYTITNNTDGTVQSCNYDINSGGDCLSATLSAPFVPPELSALWGIAGMSYNSIVAHFTGFINPVVGTVTCSDGVWVETVSGVVAQDWSVAPGNFVRHIYGMVNQSCQTDPGTFVYGVVMEETCVVDETSMTYTKTLYNTSPDPQGTTVITVEVTLGSPNPASDVYTDLETLLDQWRLDDDLLYPWRLDGNTGVAPFVTRNEVSVVVVPPISSFPVSGIDPNAAIYDGSILGAPYPAGYGYKADGSKQGIFDFRHQNWILCENDPDYLDVSSYGAWTPAYLPQNCPKWTDDQKATTYPPGAWLLHACNTTGADQNLPLTAQKWAEIATGPLPSYNFARPAGADRFVFDETTSAGADLVYQVASGYSSGTGDTISLTDSFGVALTAAPTINSGDVWGGASVGGFYTISNTSGHPDQVLLGTKIYNLPSGWNCQPGDSDSATAFGRLRFPNCPGILGRLAVSAVTNATPCHLTLAAAPYLAMNLTTTPPQSEQVDICAADMTVLASNVWLTRVSDTDFTVPNSGATAYATIATALFVVPHLLHDGVTPGTHYYWDDEQPKGDFMALEWGYDFRATAEANRVNTNIGLCATNAAGFCGSCSLLGGTQTVPFSVINSFTQIASCLPVNPCGPPVVCITPNDESFEGGEIIGFPGTFTLDEQYGARWQAVPMFAMGVPLWQKPHTPLAPIDPLTEMPLTSFAWTMDDGSCETSDYETPPIKVYYPHMPLCEARATLPTNGGKNRDETAPALPPGITIGFTSPVDHNDSQTTWPPGPGASEPWTFYEAACACMLASGPWASYYEKFVINCGSV